MAKTDIAVAELIWNLIAGKTGNVSRTDFFPQKPAFDDSVPVQDIIKIALRGLSRAGR